VVKFLSLKVQLITIPKIYFSSKFIHGNQRYVQFCVKKRVKSNKVIIIFSLDRFLSISHVFWHKMEDFFGFREWILMKNIFLETLWVTLWVIKIYKVKFAQFHCQIWHQSWNLLKISTVHKEFSNNSEASSYLLGHILLFWKLTMSAIQ
jgi:hypothetical protein